MKKNLIKLIIGLLFSAGVFVYIILINGLGNIRQQLFSLNLFWIILAIISMIIYWLLEAVVLYTISNSLNRSIKLKDSFRITMIGQFFNSITPFATGGQPAQAYELTKSGISLGVAGSILTGKFIIYQTILTFYSAIILVFKLGFFREKLSNFIYLASLGFAINTAVIVFLVLLSSHMNFAHSLLTFICDKLEKIKIIKDSNNTVKKVEDQLTLFRESFIAIRSNLLLIFNTSILTAIQLMAFFIIPYFIYRAFGLRDHSIINIISAKAFVVMITSFIPIPGASGGAEGSFYLFFSLFFNKSIIGAAVLVWRIITFYFNLLFGGLFTLLTSKVLLTSKGYYIQHMKN